LEQYLQPARIRNPTKPVAGTALEPERLRRLDEFIDAHLDQKLTVSCLAQTLGLSHGYFSRVLLGATARSPHQYLLDYRLMRARAMLLKPELAITNIAFACGFSSHAHFSAQFRMRLGIVPSRLKDDRLIV